MAEFPERELLKTKIIEDLEFLQKNSKDIRPLAIGQFQNEANITNVTNAFNAITDINNAIFDALPIEQLKVYKGVIDRFAMASRAFLSNHTLGNTQNEFLRSASMMSEFRKDTEEYNKAIQNNENLIENIENKFSTQIQFDDLLSRIERLENKPDELLQKAQNTLDEIDKLQYIAESDGRKFAVIHNNIEKYAEDTEEKANELILKLEKMRNKEISVELAIQLENKSSKLRLESFVKFIFFLLSIMLLIAFNTEFINAYLYKTVSVNTLVSNTLICNIDKLNFWQVLTLKITMNIPFFILIGFTLNEYSKSNKLYEEYEFRRISAITLFNNYSRLTNELNIEKEDLMDSLKSSLDKIFDNPVHSIYGDKSGDKNIGLDQLEKITSIIEKMKK